LRHCLDADQDPDPTFHFDADPDPDPDTDPTPGFYFSIFLTVFLNFMKKFNLALHFVEKDTDLGSDSDPSKRCRSDRIWIRIHNIAF
jgi:hypothetical protein